MTATLTAPNPAAISVDASRAHYAHAQRLADAVQAIAPDAHVRIGDLGWSVRLSWAPIEAHGLGDVTVRVPRPWDVRDGVCYARATEWQVYRSRPLTSPGRYPRSVVAAATIAVTMLGQSPAQRAERFRAARDWYYAEGACSWWADAFGQWLADTTGPSRFRTYSDAVTDWNYSSSARAYRAAHGRRHSGDGWTYGQPLVTDAPIPTDAVAAGADRARAAAAARGEYVQPLMRTPRGA